AEWCGGPASRGLPRAGHARRLGRLPGGRELRHDGGTRGLDLRAVRPLAAEQRVAFPAGRVRVPGRVRGEDHVLAGQRPCARGAAAGGGADPELRGDGADRGERGVPGADPAGARRIHGGGGDAGPAQLARVPGRGHALGAALRREQPAALGARRRLPGDGPRDAGGLPGADRQPAAHGAVRRRRAAPLHRGLRRRGGVPRVGPGRGRARDGGVAGAGARQSQVGRDDGGGGVASTVVEIPREPLPLGRLWIELRTPADTQAIRSPLLVTISDQWMVANFEEVLEFLRYIASSEELDSLSTVTGVERRERWERFWERRDPVPATPINEFREAFFERVRIATEQFGEPGRPGWRTDRGEVFIVLGRPDMVYEEDGRVGDPMSMRRIIVWIYERGPTGRLELVFEDRSGFGRYELTPASESAFRSAANRLRARWEGG